MKQRVITAAVLLAIVAAGFLVEPLQFLVVLLLVLLALACVGELDRMFRAQGVRPAPRVAMLGVAVLVYGGWRQAIEHAAAIVGMTMVLAYAARTMRGRIEGAWRDVAATLGAVVYVGVPAAMLAMLFTAGPEARLWLLLMLTIVWSTDSAAMIVGKRFGRAKIFPHLSPGKTWEGSAGGLVGALLPAVFAYSLFPATFGRVGLFEMLAVSLVFGVLTQFGDLAESLLKRDAGVKDSGSLVTGHGGALDRLDSILMTTVPFVVYLKIWHPEVF